VTDLDPVADSPERAELRAMVRRVISDVSPPDRIAELDEAEAFDEALHRALAAVDVLRLGLRVGDLRDQLVVIEELGAGPTSMAAFLISHYAAVGLVSGLGGPPDLVDAALAVDGHQTVDLGRAGSRRHRGVRPNVAH
jgi:hypothetical protein